MGDRVLAAGLSDVPPRQRPHRYGFLRNVLSWSPLDRCLLCLAIFIVAHGWFTLSTLYYRDHPAATAFVDQAFLEMDLRVRVAEDVAFLLLAIVGLLLRRRRSASTGYVYVFVFLAAVVLVHTTYSLGTVTSLFTGAALLGSASLSWILLDTRPLRLGWSFLLTMLVIIVVAEIGGVVPYAPLLGGMPFPDGRLPISWLLTYGGASVGILLIAGLLTVYAIERWREREYQVIQCNEIISRYIASQLAAQIEAGNYDLLEQHQRRKLTLFFSDIEGFTATADLVEPEDLAAALNEYLAAMTEIGERYGATIDKFVGDAIMIFFGAPVFVSEQDQAIRAVRMAIEMQARMRELQAGWLQLGFERPFRIRIGINTGHATVGNFGSTGRIDYTAIGRQVNAAARLQAQCEPGKILLSHATWVLVQDQIHCSPMGETDIRGFHHPIRVYEVTEEAVASDGTP